MFSFSHHLPGHQPADCMSTDVNISYVLFYLNRFSSLFVALVSIQLNSLQFVSIVVYLSLQQTSAVTCGALDVLMFANGSR